MRIGQRDGDIERLASRNTVYAQRQLVAGLLILLEFVYLIHVRGRGTVNGGDDITDLQTLTGCLCAGINGIYLHAGHLAVRGLNVLAGDADGRTAGNVTVLNQLINNILGGVDIDISKSEFYYINAFITETVKGTGIGSVQLKSAGVNHLDGVQAVAYGRLRLMDSDYARTERQRLVIQKAFEKAKKADFATLNSLVGNMSAMCATNINVNDLLPMVKNITKYHLGDSMGFPAARGEQKIKIGKNNAACVIPQTLVSNVTSLHNFLYAEENYTPSSTVQTISSKIASATGLSKAGKEIDHVATDQGYIPKGATETTTLSAEEESKKESQEESQMESMLNESRKESESTKETETGPDGKPIETSSGSHESSSAAYETDEHGNIYVKPTESHAASPTDEAETSTEAFRPSNPQETTAEAPVGPGYEHSTAAVPEATTSAGPASQSEAQSSVTVPGGAVAPKGPAAGV